MEDDDPRTETGSEPRSDGVPEWELFFRNDGDDRLRRAGSVTAPTAETASERATTRFGDSTRGV